jgi:hypothetical protein
VEGEKNHGQNTISSVDVSDAPLTVIPGVIIGNMVLIWETMSPIKTFGDDTNGAI